MFFPRGDKMPRQARKKSGSATYQVHLLIRKAEALIEVVSRCINAAEFQALTHEKRDWCLVQLKEKGLTVRQIERLTEINRGVVQKV